MELMENEKYIEDVRYVSDLDLPWEKLHDSSIIISGATGQIGRFLIDVIMYKNKKELMNCHIYAMSRNSDTAYKEFGNYMNYDTFTFIQQDVSDPIKIDKMNSADYILHLASNTHPVQYSTDPIGTILTNVIGLKNMLDLASSMQSRRFLFASSNEIYGENRGDVELFSEDYCGYIDCNTLRAGYPESKRCGEALCQAYIKQKNLDVVIARVTRTYGPTILASDTKALSQFLKKGLNKENIVLKSKGDQYYSYLYVTDTVTGILMILLKGKRGEAYNISDLNSDITLKELAEKIAELAGTKVVYEIPGDVEKAGYSKATKARLASDKIQKIGWSARYNISNGLKRTFATLEEIIPNG